MAIGVEIEVDTSVLDKELAEASKRMPDLINGALRACATLVAATAKQTKSFKDRDARLRPSIRGGEPYEDAEGPTVEVLAGSAEVYYAPYIEFGTNTITPRRFMRDALAKHEEDIKLIMKTAYEEAFK